MVREDPLDSEEKVSILKPKFVTIKLNYNVHKNGDLKLRFTLYKISIWQVAKGVRASIKFWSEKLSA